MWESPTIGVSFPTEKANVLQEKELLFSRGLVPLAVLGPRPPTYLPLPSRPTVLRLSPPSSVLRSSVWPACHAIDVCPYVSCLSHSLGG